MNNSIDMLPYNSYNLYYTKGCNGFVTPEGIFYKAGKSKFICDVCDYYSNYLIKTIYNEDLSEKYEEYKLNNNKELEGFEKIITLYPLVYFRDVNNELELNFNDDFTLTNQQIMTIEKLIILNNYNYDSIFQLFKKENPKTLKKSKAHK